MLPKIAITMGDPAGIGPEICLKLITAPVIRNLCIPIIFGDASVLHRVSRDHKLAALTRVIRERDCDVSSINPSEAMLLDFDTDGISSVPSGMVSASAGDAAFSYVDRAIDWHLNGMVDAIVTGPINKLAIHQAGHDFPGHTEFLAARTNSPNYCMMQYSNELTSSFVTTHVGYSAVTKLLSTQRILDVIRLSHRAIGKIENRYPSIVVCGLNPHAGESGLFGNREEEQIILPAVEKARLEGIDVVGPLPPDTCFIPVRRKSTDCFVCMYHDQGHIPLKALAFDKAVNVTLGLPIIRTSVDHGTAFDIAGKNLADPSSLMAAVKLAAKLASDSDVQQPRGVGATAIEEVL